MVPSHELYLATAQGALRKTNNSALEKELQKNATPAESFNEHSACIIDGMALVQKLKGNQKTFEELANNALAYNIIEGGRSKRIDVVFDVYREDSIKNPERANRGAKKGMQFKNLAPGHKVQHWRKFLASSENKRSLIKFWLMNGKSPNTGQWYNDNFLTRGCNKNQI